MDLLFWRLCYDQVLKPEVLPFLLTSFCPIYLPVKENKSVHTIPVEGCRHQTYPL